MDHQLDLQKVPNRKQYQQEPLRSSSDPEVVKIHLQSSLSELTAMKVFLTTTREWGADHKERFPSSKQQFHTRNPKSKS